MAIPQYKYVDITSFQGGNLLALNRALILRLFTVNSLLSPNSYIEFTNANDVATFFGSSSEEYLRALFYFNFISKVATRPQLLSFFRWAQANTPVSIVGYKAASLSNLLLVTNGSFNITVTDTYNNTTSVATLQSLNFTTAITYSDIANIIETAINAQSGLIFADASVTFNEVTGGFNFEGGETYDSTISVSQGTVGTDISSLIGWYPGNIQNQITNANWLNGAYAQSVTDVLTSSDNISNNYAFYLFMPYNLLTNDQFVESATWNYAQNVKYVNLIPVTRSNENALTTALTNSTSGGQGTFLTLIDETLTPFQYDDEFVSNVFAAIDYTKPNSAVNPMFQQYSALTPKVTTLQESNSLDVLGINYYGATQTAGKIISFFQRGYMFGNGITGAITDLNTYVNEIWLKDQISTNIMNLLIALNRVSANPIGVSQVLSVMQDAIESALSNGVISVGNPLSPLQITQITEFTGDDNAYFQVQALGYYKNATVVTQVVNNRLEYNISYTLVYTKDNIVRKVTGLDILI